MRTKRSPFDTLSLAFTATSAIRPCNSVGMRSSPSLGSMRPVAEAAHAGFGPVMAGAVGAEGDGACATAVPVLPAGVTVPVVIIGGFASTTWPALRTPGPQL